MQDLACYIGQSVPFDEGSELLSKIGGIRLTDKQIERISHHYGAALEGLEEEEYLPRAEDKTQHYAMMDGSMVYIRGEEEGWKELKLGRVFAASDAYQAKERGTIHKSQYVAHLGGHEDFLEKFDKLIHPKTDLVAISDGARWIWDYWTTFRPEAIQILDYFHVVEKIGEWASLVFKEESQKKDWIAYSESLLLNDEVAELMAEIQLMDCQGAKFTKQKQLLTYLSNNQSRMTYKTFLDAGLFIGSGAIEAANKEVIQKRFKLAGQRWTRQGLQQVVNLRVAHKSNQWQIVQNLIKIAA